MENTDNSNEQNEQMPPFSISYEMEANIYEAAKWAKVLSIIGFIGIAVMLGFSALFKVSIPAVNAFSPYLKNLTLIQNSLSVLFAVPAIVFLIPTILLYQFSSRAKKGVNNTHALHLAGAFKSLNSYFKFWGILTLILVIGFIGGLIFVITNGLDMLHTVVK